MQQHNWKVKVKWYLIAENTTKCNESMKFEIAFESTLCSRNKTSNFQNAKCFEDETNPLIKTIKTEAEIHPKSKTVKNKTSLYFKDSNGYEQYGDAADLLMSLIFKIHNTA